MEDEISDEKFLEIVEREMSFFYFDSYGNRLFLDRVGISRDESGLRMFARRTNGAYFVLARGGDIRELREEYMETIENLYGTKSLQELDMWLAARGF